MLWCLIAGILQPVTRDLCMTPVMLNPPSIQGSPWPPPWLNVCKEASGKCRNDPRSSISRTVEWSHRGYLALGFMRTGSPAELLRTRKETMCVFCRGLTAAEGSCYLCHFSTFYSVINWPGCLPSSDVCAYRPLFHFSPPSFQVSQAFVRPTTPEKDKEAHREVVRWG